MDDKDRLAVTLGNETGKVLKPRDYLYRQLRALGNNRRNTEVCFYSPDDRNSIRATISAADMTDNIPDTDIWSLYLWYNICHPQYDGNGRFSREFALRYGLVIPTKTLTTRNTLEYEDSPDETRVHIDPEFAQTQRRIILNWMEENWSEHKSVEGGQNVFQITPNNLPLLQRKIEVNSFPPLLPHLPLS